MPGETPPKTAANRLEGTHTYKKPEAAKKRARTVAQLREEGAAKSKASREEAVRRRRGSIGGEDLEEQLHTSRANRLSLAPQTKPTVQRRGSTGGILHPATSAPVSPNPGFQTVSTPTETQDSATGQTTESEARDGNTDMPSAGKKNRNSSGQGSEPGDGVDPALLRFLTTMKQDLMESTREAVGRIETRLERNEASIATLERRIEEGEKNVAQIVSAEVAKQCHPARENTSSGTHVAALERRDAAYPFSRRTLKMWPVKGDKLEDGVRNFLRTKLKMTDQRI